MRKRYRYIGNGYCKPTDLICDYRLIGGCKLHTLVLADYIRVNIPDDLVLEKSACDEYSTTEDTRTIEELGYDVMVKIRGKWKIDNTLKGVEPHEISDVMFDRGFRCTKEHGYLSCEEYTEYLRKLQESASQKEEEAKKYKRALDNHEMFVDDLEHLHKKDILKVLKLYVKEKTGKRIV